MKNSVSVIFAFLVVCFTAFVCSSFRQKEGVRSTSVVLSSASEKPKLSFPYHKQGLNARQAAAHLLSRFTYGARAEDIDVVVKLGLEKWFLQQLEGNLEDDSLNIMLGGLKDIHLSNAEAEYKFPNNGKVLRMAIKDGVIDKDSVNKGEGKEYRKQIQEYVQAKGFKPGQELYRQFINQKILRAVYTKNQLRELLTDFWFNHFNVSMTKNPCALFVPAYERDVIRPNVTGTFESLLLATAKAPAMLIYLDNFKSTSQPVKAKSGAQRPKKSRGGLNENYAREVMELHTMGVDGGYTQQDVTQVARILTGWTVAPMGENSADPSILAKRGAVRDGDFLFVPNRHDDKEKLVLGRRFPAGGGYQEGVELLRMLAHHRATAAFISKKLAVRFVNDQPAQSLVNKMSETFLRTNGDIKEVMITMASAPEFWSADALREKTKSPFELAISAVRSLDAHISQPYQLFTWISKMGQKIYYYQAPTGFPDRGQFWINTGALLNRMNFGLALAGQRIPGIRIDLAALNNHHEPESAEAALGVYSKLMLPERDLSLTIGRLKPMLNDPSLSTKVDRAAARMDQETSSDAGTQAGSQTMLAQVVGVIIGSPEFQRK